jgi:hypothetical protein
MLMRMPSVPAGAAAALHAALTLLAEWRVILSGLDLGVLTGPVKTIEGALN